MLDVGAVSSEEVINDYRIGIAAPVVPDVTCTYDEKHGLFIGKAFDCRIGCASTLATLKELQGTNLKVNLVGDFSSQEEVGTRGSIVSANTIKADLAIVFEGCPADDTVVPAYQAQTRPGGPMLRHIDSRMITNLTLPALWCARPAQRLDIRSKRLSGAGAKWGSIHLANDGIPAIVIGVSVRYAHTHYGSAPFDVEQAVRLAKEILLRINEETIRSF